MRNKQKQVQIRIDPEQHAALKQIHARDGVTVAESVRRALRIYIQVKGAMIQIDDLGDS